MGIGDRGRNVDRGGTAGSGNRFNASRLCAASWKQSVASVKISDYDS